MGPKGKKNGIKGKSEINRPKFQKGFKQFKLGKKKGKGKKKREKKKEKYEEQPFGSVIHDPQPTREARKGFGLMHPNNVEDRRVRMVLYPY